MYQIKGKLNWANVRVMLDRHIILDAKNSLGAVYNSLIAAARP
ncbi:hypothetical protein [Cardiobacterium hominis]|nr:hypothetical protein [Cardiobacterium hominis]